MGDLTADVETAIKKENKSSKLIVVTPTETIFGKTTLEPEVVAAEKMFDHFLMTQCSVKW